MIPLRRRLVRSALGLLAVIASAPMFALAQARTIRIGILSPRQASTVLPPFLKRLEELGYVEGKNLVLDHRSADGVADRLPSLARDLIRAKNDLIVAIGPEQSARSMLDSKASVPVVIVAIDYDPVKRGIVSSLRRPGGNITGVTLVQPLLAAKRLELLHDIVPKAKRYLVLGDSFTKDQIDAIHEAAERLRVEVVSETFGAPPYDFEAAFKKGLAAKIEAVIVPSSPAYNIEAREKIIALTLKYRLPSASPVSGELPDEGFLLRYDANRAKIYARAGDIAARILKGAHPGDIPVEQASEFELVVNLKTAKALKISIPQSILLRANRVIE